MTTESRNIIKAPGKINRLTTSVVYDGNLSDVRNQQIHNIVASAIGYDDNRGDSINIDGIPFDKTYQNRLDAELEEASRQEEASQGIVQGFYNKYRELINIGLIIFSLSLVITFIITRIISKRSDKKELLLSEAMDAYAAKEGDFGHDDRDVEELKIKTNVSEKTAQNYAKEHPDIAADLIKAWMKTNG